MDPENTCRLGSNGEGGSIACDADCWVAPQINFLKPQPSLPPWEDSLSPHQQGGTKEI